MLLILNNSDTHLGAILYFILYISIATAYNVFHPSIDIYISVKQVRQNYP